MTWLAVVISVLAIVALFRIANAIEGVAGALTSIAFALRLGKQPEESR